MLSAVEASFFCHAVVPSSFIFLLLSFILSSQGNQIEQAIELTIAIKENHEPTASIPDYTDTNVSIKVVKIIQSFTGIINKVVRESRK